MAPKSTEPISSTNVAVDQRGASSGGDVIGRDKINNNFERRRGQIEVWMEKLAKEIKEDKRVQEMVDSLQYFQEKHSVDGIEGLEDKLIHAGRAAQYNKALMKKEHFAKLLDKYSLYGSAQEIFAYLLSQIDMLFEAEVFPHIENLEDAEIDSLIRQKVVEPVLAEMGDGQFLVNYNHASGMVYWLAEQCFVRWHK